MDNIEEVESIEDSMHESIEQGELVPHDQRNPTSS